MSPEFALQDKRFRSDLRLRSCKRLELGLKTTLLGDPVSRMLSGFRIQMACAIISVAMTSLQGCSSKASEQLSQIHSLPT